MRGEAVMKEATSIKALISSLLMVVCVLRVCVYMVTSGVTVWVSIVSGVWSDSE